MKIEVTARGDERPRCVYCRDDVAPAELDECPGCRTTLHVACRAELERCPTAGCADARVVVAPIEPGADPAVERRRRREAARARREAEDQAMRARTRATHARSQEATRDRAVADAAPRPWPGVHRPESRSELYVWLACGAFVGIVLGFCAAGLASRHGLEAAQVLRWVPGATVVGLLEAGSLALFGVRKEPLVRVSHTSGKGSSRRRHNDASPLVIGCLVASAIAGGWLGHLVAGELGLVVGVIAAPLVFLAPVLRWLGWD
jgi:hypothetical protein